MFEVLLISGFVSSMIAAIPFSFGEGGTPLLVRDARHVTGFLLLEAAITLAFLMMLLRLHYERPVHLGIGKKEWKVNLTIGLILVPFLFLINVAVSLAFQFFLPKYFTDRNPLIEIITTPGELLLFIAAALVAGGLKEELQRAFILNRFDEHLGGAKLGLLLWSIAFGAAHYVQGPQGIVIAGLFGFFFGAVYLIRGNLIGPIVAHGLYDTIALVGYWFTREAPK